MNNPDTTMSNYLRHCKARKEFGQPNKTAIFDALAAAKIDLVCVEFDGCGDSGQIHNLTAFQGDARVALPATKVTLQQASWDNPESSIPEVANLQEAIETLCYDFLEEEHGGWEIDDGAFGEFRLDVATRTVTLEFNGRITDIATSQHTF